MTLESLQTLQPPKPDDVAAYIGALAVFRALPGQISNSGGQLSPSLARAAYDRFFIFLSKYLSGSIDENGNLIRDKLPPLDVLLVLHCYILYPLPFFEDSYRLYPQLLKLKRFPLREMIDPSTGVFVPSPAQKDQWTTTTGLSWDLSVDDTPPPPDPQDSRRLLADVAQDKVLGGTLLDLETGEVDDDGARQISRRVADIVNEILRENPNPSLADIAEGLYRAEESKDWRVRVRGILSAYAHSIPHAVDLISALQLTQGAIDRMHQVLTSGGDIPPDLIPAAIPRYVEFMKLSAGLTPESQIVSAPMDVDAVWHTHQLDYDAYRLNTMPSLGYIADHGTPFRELLEQSVSSDDVIHNSENSQGKPSRLYDRNCPFATRLRRSIQIRGSYPDSS